MGKRETGYYWVRIAVGNAWEIAYYKSDAKLWYLTGVKKGFSDKYFHKIIETPINKKLVRKKR